MLYTHTQIAIYIYIYIYIHTYIYIYIYIFLQLLSLVANEGLQPGLCRIAYILWLLLPMATTVTT